MFLFVQVGTSGTISDDRCEWRTPIPKDGHHFSHLAVLGCFWVYQKNIEKPHLSTPYSSISGTLGSHDICAPHNFSKAATAQAWMIWMGVGGLSFQPSNLKNI